MVRTPFRTVSFTLASALVLAACGDGPIDPNQGHGTLIVRADVSATAVATLVAEVTAPDIPTALLFNIPVVAGVASGTITVPAGSNRTVTLRAYDARGILTHNGSVQLDIQPGTNPAVAVTLMPLTGDQPIVVTLGSFTITVTPSSPNVAIAGTVQLGVSITDWNGAPTTGTVNWATRDPGIATVDANGLVTGASVGSTKIAATFHGATGTATVSVGP
jgi:hypothetical protein